MNSRPSGIAGMEGREPIGACLTIGIKGKHVDGRYVEGRYPTERDRFHVVAAREDGNGFKPPHPRFKRFNEAEPEYRKYVEGVLVHATRAECFTHNLRNQSPSKVPQRQKPAGRRPFCTGDGVKAQRWDSGHGEKGAYVGIECPHARCEFRQPESAKKGPSCKPFASLIFQLVIPWKGNDFPTLLAKFSTGAWSTTDNLVGLFNGIDKQALSLGMGPRPDGMGHTLFGYRFGLQLGEGRSADGRHRYPVVTVSPLVSPLEFLAGQQERFAQLGAQPRYALTDRSAEDIDNDHADYAAPGSRVEEG